MLASISWTDLPGPANTGTINSSAAVLVNDLNIRVTQSSNTYKPWKLTGVTTNAKGNNSVDPFERVDVSNASGLYTITITHSGILTGASQDFSLIVTGITTIVACNPSAPNGLNSSNITTTTADINWSSVSVADSYTIKYRISGTTSWTTASTNSNQTFLTGLQEGTTYQIKVNSVCSDGTNSSYSTIHSFTTDTPPNPCPTTIASFPYSESFENSFGGWTQDTSDDFNWKRKTGSTPSNGTGPLAAKDGSYYIYIESSSPNYSSKKAKLISPCFDLSSNSTPVLSFNSHMFGSSLMGSLKLQISINGGSWTNIWTKSGNHGGNWVKETVDLSAYANMSSIKFRFVGTTGTTWQGDMAVDNFSLIDDTPVSNCDVLISSFPYTESFENSFGDWTQNTNDDFNWKRKTGGTPSSGTGPAGAKHGSYYIFMESSAPNYSTKKAILTSSCFDLNSINSPELTFNYHMYGASNMGTLKLQISTDNGSTWSLLWSRSGNQGGTWKTATIDLSNYANSSEVKLRFNGITGTTWKGDMAVDKFSITSTSTTSASNYGTMSEETINQDSGSLIAYPNPVHDKLNINHSFENTVKYQIIDVSGRTVAAATLEGAIDVTHLKSGSYLIKLNDGIKSGTIRFVKQ